MLNKLMMLAVLLLGWSSDYDRLRALRDTSAYAHQRWWEYRCERIVLDDEVAQAEIRPKGRRAT